MDRVDPAEVCLLPEAGLSERLAWVRSQILVHAVATERGERCLAWELAEAPGLREKLERLVALERECCSSIAFVHGPGAAPGRLRLEVRGVDPDAAVFRSLRPLPRS